MGHVGLIGNFDSTLYNEVIWSLVHEFRFALIFPLFIWLLRSQSWKTCLFFTGAVSLIAIFVNAAYVDYSAGFKNSYLHSMHYLLFFMMGGLLVKNLQPIGPWLLTLSGLQRRAIFVFGLILYVYSFSISAFPKKMEWYEIAQFNDLLSDWGVGLASVIFIAFAVHSESVSKFLHSKYLLFLGKISFSLYLVHIPVLAAVFYLLKGASEIIAVTTAFPVIFVAAYVFHNAVEVPAHKVGKRFMQSSKRALVVGEFARNEAN